MLYLFTHNKFFSVAAICTLLAIIVVFLAGTKINSWSYEIQAVRGKTAQNKLLVDNFEKQLNLYRGGFDEKAEKIFNVRPDEIQLVKFLNAIDEISDASEVRKFSLQNIPAAADTDKTLTGKYKRLAYKATFEATSRSFQKFLNLFDDLPYYLETTEVSFYINPNQAVSGLADVTLNFNIFTR